MTFNNLLLIFKGGSLVQMGIAGNGSNAAWVHGKWHAPVTDSAHWAMSDVGRCSLLSAVKVLSVSEVCHVVQAPVIHSCVV